MEAAQDQRSASEVQHGDARHKGLRHSKNEAGKKLPGSGRWIETGALDDDVAGLYIEAYAQTCPAALRAPDGLADLLT
ncbi:hypothetical protein, partial [Verrucomicrobium spinosum]|uniref:hypothetical protein n=1 Tax=Verrucomicrobium spinosum TaxID=2736 RepID=UPI00210F0D9E